VANAYAETASSPDSVRQPRDEYTATGIQVGLAGVGLHGLPAPWGPTSPYMSTSHRGRSVASGCRLDGPRGPLSFLSAEGRLNRVLGGYGTIAKDAYGRVTPTRVIAGALIIKGGFPRTKRKRG